MRIRIQRILAAASLAFAAAPSAGAQSAENVAVVVNEASDASRRIAEHYIRARSIPRENVIRVRTSASETIERAEYVASIESPLAAAIASHALQDRILYIVLTKGMPLRIAGAGGPEGTGASVDSELTLLYRRMTGRSVPVRGRVANPYYLSTKPIGGALPFTHREQDIYLVSRLDGFTVEDAIALVDRAQAPVQDGRIVLDERRATGDGTGDVWLAEAAGRLRDLGQGRRVVLEATPRGARDIDNVLGYYSWGSNDSANRARRFGLTFVPGALAATFVSTDGRTFENPPDAWTPTDNWNDRSTWFGGSPQSLAGDFIRSGATGVAAHVAEPYLESTVRPGILFPAYLAGFNLVEAFYLAVPHLSWQTIVIGDPLCAPFRSRALTRADIEEPPDPDTELPGIFGRQRLEAARAGMAAKEAPPRAIALTLRAEARVARGDTKGAEEALLEATRLAPSLLSTQMQLAQLYDQTGQWQAAIERYRGILAVQPNNAAALNNLAYGLAVHQKAYDEALPLARRAVALAPAQPQLLDTYGWILHLAGNDKEAGRAFTAALNLGGADAELRLHAAIVSLANGARAAAEFQLREALRMNPALAGNADVKRLREQLSVK